MALPPAGSKSNSGGSGDGNKKNFYDRFTMVIEGNLGADPENKSTETKSILVLNVAVAVGERTEWFPVTFFDAAAEEIYNNTGMKKGTKVGVIIQSRKTTVKETDGKKQYFTDWYGEAAYIKHKKGASLAPAASADAPAPTDADAPGGIE